MGRYSICSVIPISTLASWALSCFPLPTMLILFFDGYYAHSFLIGTMLILKYPTLLVATWRWPFYLIFRLLFRSIWLHIIPMVPLILVHSHLIESYMSPFMEKNWAKLLINASRSLTQVFGRMEETAKDYSKDPPWGTHKEAKL